MSPKSGSAGSPVAPADPATPHDADKADPVETAEAKARDREAQNGKYGSTPVEAFHPPDLDDEDRKKKTSWIEIQMVNEESKPVPGRAYEVTLGDGSVASGTLDEKGLARIEGIEPGS